MKNTVLLIGNLGADPETRNTRGETTITTLSMGTSRPKRDSEGKVMKDAATGYTVQDTEWHRITCFNGLGKTVAEHATKGMLIGVRGRLHYSKWTDKDGVERYGCEIIAEEVQFLSRGKSAAKPQGDLELDDDVPF
ncbi:single-stranded DNA-binding protein [Sphingomonas sp. ID1715]|uniref:single-stranded DNA-binding protein n=1 Tax=Sphingomonas sp. ID1715 TaxID=1656898 RepID=UPI001488817D|nr:single-stranded DNA-binding protein [Sphingomonas sp. ID1715]NNM78575.1 single-stranded DNA-binding protein [Sphingomonas sp. ID1715]